MKNFHVLHAENLSAIQNASFPCMQNNNTRLADEFLRFGDSRNGICRMQAGAEMFPGLTVRRTARSMGSKIHRAYACIKK